MRKPCPCTIPGKACDNVIYDQSSWVYLYAGIAMAFGFDCNRELDQHRPVWKRRGA